MRTESVKNGASVAVSAGPAGVVGSVGGFGSVGVEEPGTANSTLSIR